jgi:hypothetical protein
VSDSAVGFRASRAVPADPTSGWPDWRDAGPYRALARGDRAGLMWEWVRRDAGYIAWHAKASAVTRGVAPEPRAWGLHFR